ncbi:protein kinase domain-containing protein [Streptomyces noursei]|uniref:protein kinase domain-containing protein n=1 Tax=Streptomyces noursei TaxID=1971 RepID=UPI00196411D2|nr:protein kinase [Streptomyces noursei]QRX93328.1 protein kinase [Streptomyces noursei]
MRGVLLAERFRIRNRLGAGGMGEVWSAQDERMKRAVAVKLVHALPRIDEAETQARFQREVQLTGRLSHQNIVTVHDWGEVPVRGHQTLYLVMELIPGVSLRQQLKESTPPWPIAVGWAAQIAQALHVAHGQGVVHRDIKPANVLLTPEGTAKVLDFGVAKFIGDTMSVHALTATGATLGSPPYMSPEQAEGVQEIDHRSDLYSLGCLLYEAVTGRPPFTGTSPVAVLRMHLDETPIEPRDLVKDLPEPLNDLIMSLLAKRPEARPLDAAAVHDTLSTLLIDHATRLPGGNLLDVVQLGHADSLAARVLKKSWQVWLRTRKDSEAKVEEAEALFAEADAYFEDTRAKAAQAAAKFEAHLAKRREQAKQADRDLATRQIVADQRLAEIETRAARLYAEAEESRADAERQAQRIVENARRQAEDIVAAANSEALQIRIDATREHTVRTSHSTKSTTNSPFGFELVRRGYDCGQVNDYITRLVAARDHALSQIAKLEELIAKLGQDGGRAADARRRVTDIIAEVHAREHRVAAPGFELVRRGYDRTQVDDYITRLIAARGRAQVRIADLARRIEERPSSPQM